MLKLLRTGVIVVALVPIGGGMAAADPNVPDGCATDSTPEGSNVPNVCQFKDSTDDGWRLIVTIENITIQSVPNLAATPTTREGYVTATATAKIERTEPGPVKCRAEEPPPETSPDLSCLRGGSLRLNAMTGCQWDASSGLVINPNPTVAGPAAGVTFTPGDPNPAQIALGAIPQTNNNSQLTWWAKPGTVVSTGLVPHIDFGSEAKDELKKRGETSAKISPLEEKGGVTRVISAQEIKVDQQNCGGPVAIRLEAGATMRTGKSFSTLTVYSATIPL